MNNQQEHIKERIASDIRLAFELLKEKTSYRHGDVNLNKAKIITSYLDIDFPVNVCGLDVLFCDLQSTYNYYICIPDPTKIEQKWLRCHTEAMSSR